VKVVFDTNVLMAAFLTEGLCSGLLIRARKQAFNLVLCDYIIQEFEGILTKKFKLSSTDISTISDIVRKQRMRYFMSFTRFQAFAEIPMMI